VPTETEINAAVKAMRETGLDCEDWPEDTMIELASVALNAAEKVRYDEGPQGGSWHSGRGVVINNILKGYKIDKDR